MTETNRIEYKAVLSKDLDLEKEVVAFLNYHEGGLIYNDGVFPFIPKDIWYLDLAVGYQKDRDTMTVEVTDISFEPGKDKEGNTIRVSFDDQNSFTKDENGNFTMWNIVFHLGEVVEKDLRKERGML